MLSHLYVIKNNSILDTKRSEKGKYDTLFTISGELIMWERGSALQAAFDQNDLQFTQNARYNLGFSKSNPSEYNHM